MSKTSIRSSKKSLAVRVEELGVFFEGLDHTPTSARIIAYLLLAVPYYQDFDSIMNFLRVSKSTTSSSLSALSNKGVVDYKTFPGDRKRYFKINPSKWLELTKQSLSKVTALEQKLTEVLSLRDSKQSPEYYSGLTELRDFFVHLDQYMMKAVDTWDKN